MNTHTKPMRIFIPDSALREIEKRITEEKRKLETTKKTLKALQQHYDFLQSLKP